ncbi:MAG: amidohydrolase family protein, partial [Planctomycetota bacterium]
MLMRSMVLLFACSCLAPAWAEESAVEADLVLVGGTIVDGSGAEPFAGDVAIQGDQIVAVGVFTAVASAERVDCTGQVVAPGFIDLHNHSDFARTESDNPTVADLAITQASTRSAANYLTQGCTTIVTGNCGGGAIDVAAYYDYMAENPPGVNVAQLIPQGALRNRVMGKVRRAATEEELTRMESIAHEAMLAGAWGMSTGLQYVPSSYADTDELVRIAKVVHSHGGIYASHMRDEGDELLEAVD